LFYQGRQVSETADLAVSSGRLGKIQVGEGMCQRPVFGHTEVPQKSVTHQVRRFSSGPGDTQIEAGFTEINGVQLGVAVGEM
jgi:hypothetical protein